MKRVANTKKILQTKLKITNSLLSGKCDTNLKPDFLEKRKTKILQKLEIN